MHDGNFVPPVGVGAAGSTTGVRRRSRGGFNDIAYYFGIASAFTGDANKALLCRQYLEE